MKNFNRNWVFFFGMALFIAIAITSSAQSIITEYIGNLGYALALAALSAGMFWHLISSTRHSLGQIEKSIYALTFALFVLLFVASSAGYFNDVLTFSFAGAFAISITLLAKRIFFR